MAEVKPRVPTEEQEQITLFNWAAMMEYRYPELRYMYHVPNGGYRNKAEAGRFRAQGVRAGVPDIVVPAARGQYHGLYIELKRTEGGKLSADQKDWLEFLTAQGYFAVMCRGWEETSHVIKSYLDHGGRVD